MATAYVSPPMLRLARSAQSASYALTANWAVIYTESSTMAYLFSGAIIDLSTMQGGDVIDIRVRKQLVSGGAWIAHDLLNYVGAMPPGHQTVHIAPIPDVWGVEIAMRQTAGILRTIDAEFYDAKRLGL